MPSTVTRILVVLLAMSVCATSCFLGNKKSLNKYVSFYRKDKNPYGSWYAYEQLKWIYPQASRNVHGELNGYEQVVQEVNEFSEDSLTNDEPSKTMMVILAQTVAPDSTEISSMLDFVRNGNYLLLSALDFGPALCDSLHLTLNFEDSESAYDSMYVSITAPTSYQIKKFSYPGFGMHSYITKFDSAAMRVIGRDEKGRPTLLMGIDSGYGCLLIQTMPFTFTNFFLLHKENKNYYDALMSYMPHDIESVIWDDQYRHNKRKNDYAALKVFMGDIHLRYALYLALLAFALLLFSELKRRQRIVPLIPAVQNSSLDFVQTIGRLYHQKKDNRNLAEKMIVNFKEFVRTKYALDTNFLNEKFVETLSYKSGIAQSEIQQLIQTMHAVAVDIDLSDHKLMTFNRQLEKFYKT
jgi:predicted nucleic acid-binding protein